MTCRCNWHTHIRNMQIIHCCKTRETIIICFDLPIIHELQLYEACQFKHKKNKSWDIKLQPFYLKVSYLTQTSFSRFCHRFLHAWCSISQVNFSSLSNWLTVTLHCNLMPNNHKHKSKEHVVPVCCKSVNDHYLSRLASLTDRQHTMMNKLNTLVILLWTFINVTTGKRDGPPTWGLHREKSYFETWKEENKRFN